MAAKRGFTLIEIVVVLVIVGVAAAFTLPNLISAIEQTKAQSAKNNLLALTVTESKYYEDQTPNAYCLAGCGDSNANITNNLRLGISGNDPFTYACSLPLPADPVGTVYRCTATDPNTAVILTLTATAVAANVTCAGPNGYCPF